MNKKLAFELSNCAGISGHEISVKKLMEQNLKPYVNEFCSDNIGSLIGVKKGSENGPKIMLAAHMDEVGFIIKKIDDKGFIYFSPVGGWWGHVLLGQRVKIINSLGKEFIGVIGSKPPHILPVKERKDVMKIEDMFIDLGAKDKQEILENNIAVGDMIVPDSQASSMLNKDYLLGKAWDDRIGCAILIEVMKKLSDENLDCNVYAVATVQEEIGLKGAKTAANVVQPDIALALDTGIAGDTPKTEEAGEAILGQGVQYTIMDGGMIIHSGLKKYIEKTAKKHKIKTQPEILAGGTTDAASINVSSSGVPSTCISLATRYIHSHNSIISIKDFEYAVELIVNLVKELNQQKMKEIING